MKNTGKMNIFYKLGFILMLVCLALFIGAIVTIYLLRHDLLGVLMAAAGVVLCLAAIIMTMLSKPKKPKQKQREALGEESYTDMSAQTVQPQADPAQGAEE